MHYFSWENKIVTERLA